MVFQSVVDHQRPDQSWKSFWQWRGIPWQIVLLSGYPERLRISSIGSPLESDLRRAEFDALARRWWMIHVILANQDSSFLCDAFFCFLITRLHFIKRRLRGIIKSISRYPTFRRSFDDSSKIILDELAKKNGDSRKSEDLARLTLSRSKSMFARIFSQKSFRSRTNNNGLDQEV